MNKLIANQQVYQTLAAAIRGGRLSHALLIEGPDGCGKATFAAEVAQAALCSAAQELRPCGQCRDCEKVEKGIHPDLLTFGGSGGSRSFHIDTVRALRAQAFVRPNEAAAKAIVLRDTHEMSTQAQNALLKIIEEPPRGVMFLLTCRSRHQMLETIRSRVQVLSLELPTPEQCAAHLQGLFPDRPADELDAAATRAGGNIGAALALLEGEPAVDEAADILVDACIGDEMAALAALSKYERDRQGLAALLERMAAVLSDTLLHGGADERLARLHNRAGRLRLLQILAIIEDTAQAVPQNVGGLLLTTSLCARIRSVLTGDTPST